jgi:nicotinate-nucleotide adenylyltransferase
MLQLAFAGHEHLFVSSIELDRGGVSYTVDTLREIRRRHPQADLFLLMGADSLQDLPVWREPEEICRLAIPVAVRRAGAAEPDFALLTGIVDADRLREIREHQAELPLMGLSSSDIRRRVAAGSSIRFQTPRAVEKYIENHGLYRHSSGELL